VAETGSAVFRAIADWAELRREAKRAAKDLKDTRSAARDLGDSFDDLDKSGDTAATRLGKVGDSAKGADKDVKGLLGSMQQWARVKAKATLGLDAKEAKAEIQRIKDDLAGFRVTRLQLDAETAKAKQELAQVENELTRLRTQPTSAKVDADIKGALARIGELKARIASIRDARLRVDADTAKAKAQLAGVSRDADQLGRKRPTVKVDVDTSKLRVLAVVMGAITAAAALIGPAVGAVTALAAGLFSLAAAAAPAVGGLLGVAAAAGAVAQAVGVAAIALSGVGKAVKALQAKQASAGSSAASSAKAQEAAADRIAAAQRGVTRAIEQRNRTAIQGQQAIESAERSVAAAVESSARRIASAERAHADAVRDVERARADLNRELELAQQRMEDLALAAEGGTLDEEAATIRLQRAQQDLARVRRLGGSGLDLQEAQLGVKQAEHNLKEIQASNADLAAEVKKAATEGVEGDEQVIAARERVVEATQGVQDAEADLTQARKDGRAEVEDAERQLSQTIQQTAWANGMLVPPLRLVVLRLRRMISIRLRRLRSDSLGS
jgi:chromosome segregation ATPase